MKTTSNSLLLAAMGYLLPVALAQRCNEYVPNPPNTRACGYTYFEPYEDVACPTPDDFWASMGSAIVEGGRCYSIPFTIQQWSVHMAGFSVEGYQDMPPTKFGACPDSNCNLDECELVDTIVAEDGQFSVDCFETTINATNVYFGW